MEALESRRLYSGTAAELATAVEPLEATVWRWTQPSISWARNEAIAAPTGARPQGEFGRFEATLPPDDYAVMVDWGDGTTSAGWIYSYWLDGYDGRPFCAFVGGDHEYAAPGTYKLIATVTASDGARTTFHQDVIPFASPIQLVSQYANGFWQADTYRASYDVLVFPGAIDIDGLSGTIDWGDGTRTSVAAGEMIWSGAIPMGANHIYDALGTYNITFTATAPGSTPGAVESLVTSKELTIEPWRPPEEGDLVVSEPVEWTREIIQFSEHSTVPDSDAAPSSEFSSIQANQQSADPSDVQRRKLFDTSITDLLGIHDLAEQ